MPMAPMPQVSEAVTNPLMKLLSPSLPVLCLSHAPIRSKNPSISISSPIKAPNAIDMTMLIVPVVPSVPSGSTVISREKAPAAPMNMIAIAVALSTSSL